MILYKSFDGVAANQRSQLLIKDKISYLYITWDNNLYQCWKSIANLSKLDWNLCYCCFLDHVQTRKLSTSEKYLAHLNNIFSLSIKLFLTITINWITDIWKSWILTHTSGQAKMFCFCSAATQMVNQFKKQLSILVIALYCRFTFYIDACTLSVHYDIRFKWFTAPAPSRDSWQDESLTYKYTLTIMDTQMSVMSQQELVGLLWWIFVDVLKNWT